MWKFAERCKLHTETKLDVPFMPRLVFLRRLFPSIGVAGAERERFGWSAAHRSSPIPACDAPRKRLRATAGGRGAERAARSWLPPGNGSRAGAGGFGGAGGRGFSQGLLRSRERAQFSEKVTNSLKCVACRVRTLPS